MSSLPNLRNDRTLMVEDRLLSGEDKIKQYCKKHGLCNICGQFQTHKKGGPIYNRIWEPMTVEDEYGNITVYKGHCIQATCYSSVDQVKELLGEIPKKKPPRSSIPVSPVPMNSGSKASSPPSFSLSSSSSARKPFQPGSVYIPPSAPNLRAEGSMNIVDVSNHGEENADQDSSGYLELSEKLKGLPSEDGINCFSKKSTLLPKTSSRLLRHSLRSTAYESEFSLYEHGSRGSHVYESIRSSFLSTNIGSSSRGLPREHSQFLVGSTLMDAGVGSREGTDNGDIVELKAQLSEGDYVKFIAELDRRCSNGLVEGEKAIVLDGLRLLRFHIVKDQLSKPNGVVLPGENWVKTINLKMEDCMSDKDIVVSSLLTFLTFSTLPCSTYKKSMMKKGGVETVMKILDHCKGDELVPALACSLFISLGLSEKDGLNAKFDKIVILVKRLVALVANNECGRDFALRALFHFSFQRRKAAETNKSLSHDVKLFLSTEENLRSLCEVITEKNIRETAVESSLSLLWKLSCPKDNEEEDMFPVSPDLVDSIITAMNTFKSASIREAGCGILANIAMRENFPSERIEAALACIHSFLHIPDYEGTVDEGLATCAMHAICNMLEEPSFVKVPMAVQTNVFEATLAIMKQFPESEELIEFACLVLAHASRENHAIKEALVLMGGFGHVMAAFEEFVTKRAEKPSLGVKDAALCALASLTGCRVGAKAVLNSGLLEILQTLLAVETDKDFADILDIVIRNTESALTGGFEVHPLNSTCEQPQIFWDRLKNSESAAEAASILQYLIEMEHRGPTEPVVREQDLSTLQSILLIYRNSEQVQESGCALLSEMYYYIPDSSKVTEGPWDPQQQRKSLQSIDTAMYTHQENADVQINGCLVILNLMAGLSTQGSDRSAAIFMMDRCLNRISETLLFHESNKTVQKRAIAALGACIGISDDSILTGWNARIIHQLLDALAKFRMDSEILTLALEDLMILLGLRYGFDTIRNSIGISLLFDLLGSSNADVCMRAAAILALLVEIDFMVSSQIMEFPDSISKLFLCMHNNQDNQGLQVCISTIQESLVNYADSIAIEQILQNNGVASLCNLMSIHRNNGDFVLSTCHILSSIFPNLDSNTLKSMSDLIKQSLVDALERHVENADVEAAIFDALKACCLREDIFKRLLLEESRIRMILSAMQLNLGSSELQRSGCGLIRMLSSFANGKVIVGNCGGIPTIINALLAHNESTAVQKEALVALKNLAIAPSNKKMLADSGAENAVMCSLWIHYKDPQVIAYGLSAMNNIAVDSQTRSVAEMKDQMLMIVIAAMSRCRENAEVLKNACFYLKSCSYLSTNLHLMKRRREQLVPLLLWAAESFPDHCRERAKNVVFKIEQAPAV
ncbi:Armadillo/beta-catenin-like repeat protein [Nitzschia inconspicua]|uniref:Armadillo/beta-catenin-like repeat protein n=1 Tax=Nitzschia inconspicua TaxID=303405 RepID=A0A9K3PJ04_9STRA|nr:Armadillo/beta-catenin-like repeat protein [Nitzschia inconspicua]